MSGELTFVDGPDGPTVVKRALPKLKVAADWFASPKRSAVEAAIIRPHGRPSTVMGIPTAEREPDSRMA